MGLDVNSIRYHCWLKRNGVRFGRTAMLGRQSLHGLSPKMLSRAVIRSGLPMSQGKAEEIMNNYSGFSEGFYKWLGAEIVDSFDYSDYENATYQWDMNGNLRDEFKEKYDFVFDGGTLEHVYYYSQALKEAMSLVKKGGVFLSATPANSYLGHGFYQFGPDLPYAVMKETNGYEYGGVHLVEMRNNASFYEVITPKQRVNRALVSTFWPTMMLFWGRRIGEMPSKLQVFQPDYETAWVGKGKHPNEQGLVEKVTRCTLGLLPLDFKHDLFRLFKLIYTAIKRNALFDKSKFRIDIRI